MLEARGARMAVWPTWLPPSLLILGLGLASGAFAAVVLAFLHSPLLALLVLVGLGAGVAALLAPRIAVMGLVGASMVYWPGGYLKFAMLGLTFCVLLWALAERRRLVPRDRLFVVQLLLLGLGFVSLLSLLGGEPEQFAADPWVTPLSGLGLQHERAIRAVGWYASDAALVWMILTVVTTQRDVRRLTGIMLIAGTLIAFIGLVQFRTHFIWSTSEHTLTDFVPYAGAQGDFTVLNVSGAFRIDSLTGVPDYMAMFMQILIPFALFWSLRQTSQARRAAGAVAVMAMAVAEVLTFSRMTMVSSVLVVLPYFLARFGFRRSLPVLAAVALVASGVVFGYGPVRDRTLSIITDITSLDPTTAGGWRVLMLPAGAHMFWDHVLTGVGVGEHEALFSTYLPAYLQIDPRFNVRQPLENAYLLIGVELGVGGLALLLAAGWMVWPRARSLRTYFRQTQQATLLDLAHAGEIAWVCILVDGLFATVVDGTFRYLWVIVALLTVLSRIRSDQQRGVQAAWESG